MLDEKLMSGKKGLVMGVANDRSISWAIAKKKPLIMALNSLSLIKVKLLEKG